MDLARWRDGEMVRDGKNKLYFFTKRKREKEKLNGELRMEI